MVFSWFWASMSHFLMVFLQNPDFWLLGSGDLAGWDGWLGWLGWIWELRSGICLFWHAFWEVLRGLLRWGSPLERSAGVASSGLGLSWLVWLGPAQKPLQNHALEAEILQKPIKSMIIPSTYPWKRLSEIIKNHGFWSFLLLFWPLFWSLFGLAFWPVGALSGSVGSLLPVVLLWALMGLIWRASKRLSFWSLFELFFGLILVPKLVQNVFRNVVCFSHKIFVLKYHAFSCFWSSGDLAGWLGWSGMAVWALWAGLAGSGGWDLGFACFTMVLACFLLVFLSLCSGSRGLAPLISSSLLFLLAFCLFFIISWAFSCFFLSFWAVLSCFELFWLVWGLRAVLSRCFALLWAPFGAFSASGSDDFLSFSSFLKLFVVFSLFFSLFCCFSSLFPSSLGLSKTWGSFYARFPLFFSWFSWFSSLFTWFC